MALTAQSAVSPAQSPVSPAQSPVSPEDLVGAAGPLGVSRLLGGVNGLLGEGPTGELHADIRAVVAAAIEIRRRNRIGTRLIPHSGVPAAASGGPRSRHQPASPQWLQGQ